MKSIKSTRYITIGIRGVVVLFLLLTAGESFAQKVSVDLDKDIDFSKYLIVDIGDLSTKKYIWRGTATITISSKPDKNAKAIDKAAKKMFQKFPAQWRG